MWYVLPPASTLYFRMRAICSASRGWTGATAATAGRVRSTSRMAPGFGAPPRRLTETL